MNLLGNQSARSVDKSLDRTPKDGMYYSESDFNRYVVTPEQAKYWGSVVNGSVQFSPDAIETFKVYQDDETSAINADITSVTNAANIDVAAWQATDPQVTDKGSAISSIYKREAIGLQHIQEWQQRVATQILNSYVDNRSAEVTKVFDEKQHALDAANASLSTLLNGSSNLQLTSLGSGYQAQGPSVSPTGNVTVPQQSSGAGGLAGIAALLLFL